VAPAELGGMGCPSSREAKITLLVPTFLTDFLEELFMNHCINQGRGRLGEGHRLQ